MALEKDDIAGLHQWLKDHGVERKHAETFCARSGCRNIASMALYLRFQLSIPFSNEDILNEDMRSLLGVGPLQGKRIVEDLDVASKSRALPADAVSLDTTEEATKHLGVTGHLTINSKQELQRHLAGASGSILWGATNPLLGMTAGSAGSMSLHFPAQSLHRIDESNKPTEVADDPSAPRLSHSIKRPTLATANSLTMYTQQAATGRAGLSMSLGQPSATLNRSVRRQGYPTVSTALEPGPYHMANAQLRKQLMHYDAKVTVKTVWHSIVRWTIALCAWAVYIIVRLVYLIIGKTTKLMGDPRASTVYSIIILIAETAIGVIHFTGCMRFWKQEVKFTENKNPSTQGEQESGQEATQTVHVLIATYTEPLETVRECVIRCLVAPEPAYMEKNIFVCDDGHAKSDGPRKRAMVEELRILGHTNIFYIGDRVKRSGQLNGKSANLNHAILRKVFPSARTPKDVPIKDILLVMDVDHLVKPDIFNRMGPCMLDERVAVTLVPQSFHNALLPDAFDFANEYFMFTMLPYYFGAGTCFITGTNVMIRARSAFEVCKGTEQALHTETLEDGLDKRQIYAEDQVSEDVELGSRLHCAGFKSVFLAENLATGEVPLDPRSTWRQRLRWAKGGHLYVLAPDAVIWVKSPHLTLYQKYLYAFPLFAHFVAIWAEPMLFTLPFLCLVLEVCPYGMDQLLFWSHVANLVATTATQIHPTRRQTVICFRTISVNRLLYFTYVKAVLNTLMVATGYKSPGHFKFTPKAGNVTEGSGASGVIGNSSPLANTSPIKGKGEPAPASTSASHSGESKDMKLGRTQLHSRLSKVTEMRRMCMPLDGTLDMWVLVLFMCLSVLGAVVGLYTLAQNGALLKWDDGRESLRWIGVVWAVSDCTPGLLFLGYVAAYEAFPRFLKVWLPLVANISRLIVGLIYIRVCTGYLFSV